MKFNHFLTIFSLFFFTTPLFSQPISPAELSKKAIFTSMEEALKKPEQVYRLKLKSTRKCDSIPEDVFQFPNLQELRVTGCKIRTVNQKINKLQYLQFLYLNRNKIFFLPETICDLPYLQLLDISRNPINQLPENIGNLTNLEMIDAWETQIFVLPQSIEQLQNTLKIIDLRQVPLRVEEHNVMEKQLPKTHILYTFFCECNNNR